MRFVAVGDNCIDWYFLQDESHVGGCSLNVAVYMKQFGEESSYVSAVGKDRNGTIILDSLKRRGVDVSHLHILEGRTAVTKIELVDHDRTFHGYDEGVLGEKYLTEEDVKYICSFDYMHTSVYGNCEYILPRVKDAVKICYDFAYKLEERAIPEILQHIHFGFFSYKRDDEYIRRFLKDCWEASGPQLRLLIVTLGSEGSLAYDGSYYKHVIEPVKPVDTMGAGDSYIAGFLYGLSQGEDLRKCMELGSEKARETVLIEGAFADY